MDGTTTAVSISVVPAVGPPSVDSVKESTDTTETAGHDRIPGAERLVATVDGDGGNRRVGLYRPQ
jgi:hypothetical protein